VCERLRLITVRRVAIAAMQEMKTKISRRSRRVIALSGSDRGSTTTTRVKSRAIQRQYHMTVRYIGEESDGNPHTHTHIPWVSTLTMGKRKKSSRKPGPKRKREPLGKMDLSFSAYRILMDDVADSTFTCLFCHHDNSVTVKLDRKEGVAQLICKICGQSFQSKVNRTFARVT
jgi:transcription elongation factor Elf1